MPDRADRVVRQEGQRKDLRLALQLGAEHGVPLLIAADTELAFTRLIAPGLGEGRDFAALILQAARDAGMAIEPEGDLILAKRVGSQMPGGLPGSMLGSQVPVRHAPLRQEGTR